MNLAAALTALEAALQGEREALITLDGESLIRFGEAKLAAVDEVSSALQSDQADADAQARLSRAFDQHQGNANLLLRRRQETSWLLQTLGAVAPASAYDAQGGRSDLPLPRRLAEA